jgi:hypothetical protein
LKANSLKEKLGCYDFDYIPPGPKRKGQDLHRLVGSAMGKQKAGKVIYVPCSLSKIIATAVDRASA